MMGGGLINVCLRFLACLVQDLTVLRKLRMGPLLCSLNADRRSPLSRAIARPRMSESLGEGLSLHLRGNADRRQIPALGNL